MSAPSPGPIQPRWMAPICLAAAAWLAWVSAAAAAAPDPASLPLADAISWEGFVNYWKHYVNSGNRVIQVVLLVMLASLFIITRGKWKK
jgi:hypothetical protein